MPTPPSNDELLGRYAAAAGHDRDETKPAAWLESYDAVMANIKNGRDPAGLPPNVPGLCAKDVRIVCNCNVSTREACTHEKYPPIKNNILTRNGLEGLEPLHAVKRKLKKTYKLATDLNRKLQGKGKGE